MRRFLVLLLVIGLTAWGVGCGGGSVDFRATTVDPADLLTILPTPAGFDQSSSDLRTASTADVQLALGGVAKPAVAAEYEGLGFEAAAIRRWRGPDGAAATLVASRWGDHLTATNIGAGPSQLLNGSRGATAWTPTELPGARGVQVSGTTPITILSIAVDDMSVFMRVDGRSRPEALVRTLELAVRRLREAANPT